MTADFWEAWPTLDGPAQWAIWFEQVQSYARRKNVWRHLDPENAAPGLPAVVPSKKPTSSQSYKQRQVLTEISIAISRTVGSRYANQVRALKSASAAIWWLRITLSPSTDPCEEARAAARIWHLVTQRGDRDWRSWCLALQAQWRLCVGYSVPFLQETDMIDEFLQSIGTFPLDDEVLDRYMDWGRPSPNRQQRGLGFFIDIFECHCEVWFRDEMTDKPRQLKKGTLQERRLRVLEHQRQRPEQVAAEVKAPSVSGKSEKSTMRWWKSKPPCPGCGVVHFGNRKVWWESCWIFLEMHLEECARVKTRSMSFRIRETRETSVTTRLQVHVEEKEAAYSWLRCLTRDDDKGDDAECVERCKGKGAVKIDSASEVVQPLRGESIYPPFLTQDPVEVRETRREKMSAEGISASERKDESVKEKGNQTTVQKTKKTRKMAEQRVNSEAVKSVNTKKTPEKKKSANETTDVNLGGKKSDEQAFSQTRRQEPPADTTRPQSEIKPQYRPDTSIAWARDSATSETTQNANGGADKKQVKKDNIKKDEAMKIDDKRTTTKKDEVKADDIRKHEYQTRELDKDETKKDEVEKGAKKSDVKKTEIRKNEPKKNQESKDEETTEDAGPREMKGEMKTVEKKYDEIKTGKMDEGNLRIKDMDKSETKRNEVPKGEIKEAEAKKDGPKKEEARGHEVPKDLRIMMDPSRPQRASKEASPTSAFQEKLEKRKAKQKQENGESTQGNVEGRGKGNGETGSNEGSRTANDGPLEDETVPATPITVRIKHEDPDTEPKLSTTKTRENKILQLKADERAMREAGLTREMAKPLNINDVARVTDGPPYHHITAPDPSVLAARSRNAVILSTETSTHIFNDRSFFQDDFTHHCPRQTVLKGGDAHAPLGCGSVTLATGVRGMSIALSGCYYVPGMRASFISARALLNDGYVWAVSRSEIYALPDRLTGYVVFDHDLESYVLTRLDLRPGEDGAR